jgi:hypothetical protein
MVVEALAEVHSPSWEEQRHESLRNLRDLTPAQLVEGSIPPVELSVLGLVRHMTEMEHVFLAWGLAGGEQRLRYGDDGLRRRLGRDDPRGPALVLRGSGKGGRRHRNDRVTRHSGRGARRTSVIQPRGGDRRVRPPRRTGALLRFAALGRLTRWSLS